MSIETSNVFSAAARKLSLFPDQLAAWKAGELRPPVTLEIQPTERCNHLCPACQGQFALPLREVRSRSKAGADLDLSVLESVWAEPPAGIVLSGNTGDPLLHPQILALLSMIRERKIPAVLISNGEAMTEEIAAALVRTCRGVRISLDASDERGFLQRHGRGPEGWAAVLRGLRMLVKHRRDAGVSKAECMIGVGYLTNEQTAGDMYPAGVLARDLGVDYIQFRPFHFSMDDVQPEVGHVKALAVDGFTVLASTQKYDRVGGPERSYHECHGAHFYTVLDARADFYVCCHTVGVEAARIGSLHRGTWSQVMRSPARSEAISRIDVAKCVPLCRLNAHNETLEAYRQGTPIVAAAQDATVAFHAPFL